MTYLPAGALTDDATPGGAVDPIRMWAEIKTRLKTKLGIYEFSNGDPVIVNNKTYPLLTSVQANALWKGLGAIGDDMSRQLVAAGRDQGRVTAAGYNLASEYAGWVLKNIKKYDVQKWLGKYLYIAAVRDLFLIFDRYAIALSGAVWAGYNMETSYERALWALDETPGGWILKWPFEAGYGTAKCFSDVTCQVVPDFPDFGGIAEFLKWGSIAGGLFGLYWILKPEAKKAR